MSCLSCQDRQNKCDLNYSRAEVAAKARQ